MDAAFEHLLRGVAEGYIPDGRNGQNVGETVNEHHNGDVQRSEPADVRVEATLNEEEHASKQEHNDYNGKDAEVFVKKVVIIFDTLLDLEARNVFLGGRAIPNG